VYVHEVGELIKLSDFKNKLIFIVLLEKDKNIIKYNQLVKLQQIYTILFIEMNM